jgi:pyruvate dehydrogenase E2 component (dihydrolipoamide acetyltransferase)
VIRSAERKTITQIHNELQAYKANGQSMSFTPGDFADGHFTLSNLGMYGVDRFRAIVNPPQCAVLAVGRIAPTPTSTANEKIELRPLINLGLTVDHRCLDGMQGAQFLACIKELVENPLASLVRFESA